MHGHSTERSNLFSQTILALYKLMIVGTNPSETLMYNRDSESHIL